MSLQFDEYEMTVVKFLARRFHNGAAFVDEQSFPDYETVGEDRVCRLVAKFQNYGLLESQTCSSWSITSRVVTIADEIENPPLPDYWAAVIARFRSKWWSVPIVAVFVLLPLLVQWVEMLRYLLGWLVKD